MGTLANKVYKKYQVTIDFEMDEHFTTLIPKHREYIKDLIDKGTIDYYSVSLLPQRSWIVITATSKREVKSILKKSALYKFWTLEVNELIVYDAQTYRLPALQPN